jgi:hypothetical protein
VTLDQLPRIVPLLNVLEVRDALDKVTAVHIDRLLPSPASRISLRQDFVISASDGIGAGDHANCRCRAGVTLRTCRSCRAGRASGTLRPWWSAFAAGSDWALATGFSLRALRSDRSGWARRASRPALADGALWTDWALLTLCTLRACRDQPDREGQLRQQGLEDLAVPAQGCKPPTQSSR